MKSYYHAHESAYKSIKDKGQIGWGNISTLDELKALEVHSILKTLITKWANNPVGKSALDIGTGTGTTAFTLAKIGFKVTGIDISETAIELALDLASKLNLKIEFKVSDLLTINQLKEKYDLIYDSHCLHCIVFEEDRKKVFSNIRDVLNPNGIFILDTMTFRENIDVAGDIETLRFDENYILWHKTSSDHYLGTEEINGQKWCAQRRIYPADKILEEVKLAGFKILNETRSEQGSTEPSMLRLVLTV